MLSISAVASSGQFSMTNNFYYRNTKAAKLTPGKVAEIKRLYGMGRTQSALSREYQVTVGQIGRIVRGESWQGIAAEPSQEEIDASWARIEAGLNKKPQEKEDELKVLKDAFGEEKPINPLDE